MTTVQRARSWLRSQKLLYLSLLALPVGAIAAYAALALRLAIEGISVLNTGQTSWTANLGQIPWYTYLLAPSLGGLAIGLIQTYWLRTGRMTGVAGLLEAMIVRAGRCDARQAMGEATGAAITLGCGASMGREGPTLFLGAAIASLVGQRLKVNEVQMRVLIGCGVAAGIAASFNTPLAGVLFALEVILAEYAVATLGPIVLAAVVATVITRAHLGDFPAFEVPAYHMMSGWEIVAYLLVGISCGLSAVVFIRGLSPIRRLLAYAVPSLLWRPAIVGLGLGVIGLAVPHTMSIGYEVMSALLRENLQPQIWGVEFGLVMFFAVLLAAKLVATMLAAGGGFLGGLIGPSLFLGAVMGGMVGSVIHGLFPMATESFGAYALVASGAFAAGTLQAPMSIILMVFELTGDYRILPPLMAASIVATLLVRMMGRASIFTEMLKEKGVDTDWRAERAWLHAVQLHQVPWQKLPQIGKQARLAEVKRRFFQAGRGLKPLAVVDEEGRPLGIITFSDLQPWMLDSVLDQLVVADEIASHHPLALPPDATLLEAIEIFEKHPIHQILIVEKKPLARVLGMLDRDTAFATYDRLIRRHGE